VHISGFPPIADRHATCLILGTMPGNASLRAGEYYAFGRNAFWSIIEAQFGIARTAPYPERSAALRANRIALWDVLRSCHRQSSLDADIVTGSAVSNDIAAFLREHPAVSCIYFNGAGAEALYRRHVRQGLSASGADLRYRRLPSTSPANARLNLAAKVRAWSIIRNGA
jgi:double-stranded uracil-DNA glycosylase